MFRLMVDMARYSSLHGFGWYDRTGTRDSCFGAAVVVVSVALMVFTPIFIAYEFRVYADDDSVYQNLHTYRAEAIDYPNITICNPRFFKTEYLQAYNISNDLANYMLLALDPTARKHADFMSMSFPPGEHSRKLRQLDQQLQAVIRRNNLDSLLELFYLVADK